MNRFLFLLTAFMLCTSSYSFGAEEMECPEGQIFDPDLEMCVDAEDGGLGG